MKSLIRWLRLVYPPGWAVAIALSGYVICEAIFWWTHVALGVPAESLGELLRIRDGLMILNCAVYAGFRICAFHPIFRPKYRYWLSQTPWNSSKPLPLGPVTLVAQDLLVLAVARASLHGYQSPETMIPQLFLMAYLAAAAVAIWASGTRLTAYGLMFVLGLAIRLGPINAWLSLGVLGAGYALAVYGLRLSLVGFPWTPQIASVARQFTDIRNVREGQLLSGHLGWPYALTNSEDQPREAMRGEYLLISLLAGWWFYAVTAIMNLEGQDVVAVRAFMIGWLTLACVAGRLFLYFFNHWPPISLWGRLWTGRWIIPAYDVGFVAPAISAAVGWGGLFVLRTVAAHEVTFVPPLAALQIILVLVATFTIGPSHRRWRLTTPCRIAPVGLGMSPHFEKL